MKTVTQPDISKDPAGHRLFIVDHMCVLPYGHNQGSLALFCKELSPHFNETITLVPKALPAEAARAKNFVRCLSYPYSALIETRFAPLIKKLMPQRSSARYCIKEWLRFTERAILAGIHILTGFDVLLNATRRDWKKVFRRYAITDSDTVFFPSADYYGAIGLLDWLLEQSDMRVKVHLRMIGVTENAAIRNIKPRADLLQRVKQARTAGLDVAMSAETPVYASYLTSIVGFEVFYFPYPLVGPLLPMPRKKPADIVSIGQGRRDKGYFSLKELVRHTGFARRGDFIFTIQSIPNDHPDYCPRYERTLNGILNVRLLPAQLGDEEIAELYRDATAVLLPYDRKTYALRGSAVYQEATAFGRPVISLGDVGFAGLIERYNNGYACHDLKECAEAVRQCIAVGADEWERRMQAARALYMADIEEAIRLFLGTESAARNEMAIRAAE